MLLSLIMTLIVIKCFFAVTVESHSARIASDSSKIIPASCRQVRTESVINFTCSYVKFFFKFISERWFRGITISDCHRVP